MRIIDWIVNAVSCSEKKKSFEEKYPPLETERDRVKLYPDEKQIDWWAERIEDNDATFEEARDHMSDPTWYRLKSRVEE